MAKDSPWFKWIPSEWNDGQISLCTYAAKGLFADLCSLYWSREGDLSRDFAQAKLPAPPELWQELFSREIYSLDEGKIVVKFLDEQLSERVETSKKAKESIAKRWERENKKGQKEAKNTVVSGAYKEPYYDKNTPVKQPYYGPDTNKKEKEIREDKTSLSKKERSLSTSNGSKSPNGSPSPLYAVGMTAGSVNLDTWKKYGEHLQKILPDLDRERMAKAWRNYWPYMADPDRVKAIEAVIEPATDEQLRFILDEVGELLILGDPRAFDDPIEFATGYLKP
jgi:hypothetical protein